MGKPRTKRKNAQKRRKRRVFAAIASEIRANEDTQWTPEALELERMRAEEASQRTHEQWVAAVMRSAAAFDKRKQVLEERHKLILALRQQMKQESEEDSNATTATHPQDAGQNSGTASNTQLSLRQTVVKPTAPQASQPEHSQRLSDKDAALLLVQEAQTKAYEAMRIAKRRGARSSTLSRQAALEAKLECVFYSRTGCCPFGSAQCARAHSNPPQSRFLLLKHMYTSADTAEDERDGAGLAVASVTTFYEDVLGEIRLFGDVVRMEVAQNEAEHLCGNVYVEFDSTASALKAWRALRLRWYGGRKIQAELVALDSWEAALCGPFLQSRCARGNQACNYLHLHTVPSSLKPGASTLHKLKGKGDEQFQDIVEYFDRAKTTAHRGQAPSAPSSDHRGDEAGRSERVRSSSRRKESRVRRTDARSGKRSRSRSRSSNRDRPRSRTKREHGDSGGRAPRSGYRSCRAHVDERLPQPRP